MKRLLAAVMVALAAVLTFGTADASAAGSTYTYYFGGQKVQGIVAPGWVADSYTSGAGCQETKLLFQSDGNLVLYYRYTPSGACSSATWVAQWASNTVNSGGYRLYFQFDNNMVIYDRYGRAVWASGTDDIHSNYPDQMQLVVDPTGYFRLNAEYSGTWKNLRIYP